MSILDIAQSRKGKLRDGYSAAKAGVSVADTRVEYGTAVGDSSDGYVTIRMDNSPTDGTADFSVPCDAPITQGDRVSYISTKGKGKAVSVGTLAQIAQDAEDIATATNQYFWNDTNGIHVSTDAEDPAGARNILINSLGILLRKLGNTLVSISEEAISFFDGAGTKLATFGKDGATIGADGSPQVQIHDGRLTIGDSQGAAIADFGLSGASVTSNVTVTKHLDYIGRPGNMTSIRATFDTSAMPTFATGGQIIVNVSGYIDSGARNQTFLLTEGTAYTTSGTWSYTYEGVSNTANYELTYAPSDDLLQFTVRSSLTSFAVISSFDMTVYYEAVSYDAPAYTLGTRTVGSSSGAYTLAAGEEIIASSDGQAVTGRFNVEDTGDDYALVIGNGTADNTRSNAFTVGWNGDITASGEVIDGFGNKLSTAGGGSQQNYYATCSTNASTQAKEITIAGWTPAVGDILLVKFTTANTHNTPKLKINGTSYNITIGTTTVAATTNVLKWSANTTLLFMCTTSSAFSYITARAAASVVPPDGAGHWYGTSVTADGTAGKTATIDNFRLMKGATVDITFSKPQTSLQALTLNVNSTAAKAIYAHDSACSATYCIQWGAGETLRFVFSGSYWYVLNRDIVLYRDPTGVNANSSLTLSKSAANFSWLDFIYTDGSRTYSDRLYQPDGKAISLMRMVNSGTVQYVDSLMVSVSGTSVTTGNGMQSLLDSGVFSDTNCHINIIEIRGGY